jgi:hypothetical protein
MYDMAKFDNFEDLDSVYAEFDKSKDVVEPFDPAYVSDKGYEIPDISAYEKRFLRKVSIMEKKLRKARISFEWNERYDCFQVKKYVNGSEYPTYRYVGVNMDENDYFFGTEKEDLVFDGKVSVVVDAVAKWINSELRKK